MKEGRKESGRERRGVMGGRRKVRRGRQGKDNGERRGREGGRERWEGEPSESHADDRAMGGGGETRRKTNVSYLHWNDLLLQRHERDRGG